MSVFGGSRTVESARKFVGGMAVMAEICSVEGWRGYGGEEVVPKMEGV